MPHMLTIDVKNNVWVTDVALHQVFKFGPYGGDGKPLIALGRKVRDSRVIIIIIEINRYKSSHCCYMSMASFSKLS